MDIVSKDDSRLPLASVASGDLFVACVSSSVCILRIAARPNLTKGVPTHASSSRIVDRFHVAVDRIDYP